MKRIADIGKYELTTEEFMKLVNRDGKLKYLSLYGDNIIFEVEEWKKKNLKNYLKS